MTIPAGGPYYGGYWPTFATAHGGALGQPNPSHEGAAAVAASYAAYRAYGTTVPIPDAGIRAGEIAAYRAWHLGRDGRLHSVFAPHVWEPGAIEDAGEQFGWKGLHAFKTMAEAKSQYWCYRVYGPVVFGEVALWGLVVEHEHGYRARFARIVRLESCHDFGSFMDFIVPFKKRMRMAGVLREVRRTYGLEI